jgi:hypothetical protein
MWHKRSATTNTFTGQTWLMVVSLFFLLVLIRHERFVDIHLLRTSQPSWGIGALIVLVTCHLPVVTGLVIGY